MRHPFLFFDRGDSSYYRTGVPFPPSEQSGTGKEVTEMKARLPIDGKMKKRILDTAKAETEKMQTTYIKLVLKLTARQLYKYFGFGKIRTMRVIRGLTDDLGQIGEDYGLDCVMVKLDDELRRLGIVDKNGEWNFEEEGK